jgi:predicted transcriptional regulator
MKADRVLSHARHQAGLTQRELARRASVPQASIARIELGIITPRVDGLERLLRACGRSLESAPALGVGIDRSVIRERLAMTPEARSRRATDEGRALLRLLALRDASRGRPAARADDRAS